MKETTSKAPVALVTGGSAGLGLVVAKTFLDRGYYVVIVGRNQDRLDRAREQMDSARVEATTADLSIVDDTLRVAEFVEKTCGRLDVLVNCVGTSDRGTACELTPERLHELMDQNVVSALLCSQAMIPLLEKTSGTIVNIGSLSGKVGARYLGGYNAVKHALAGLTQQMRLELKPRGIHVAIVHPGPIRRQDAGERYGDSLSEKLPDQASAPGGGTKLRGLDPQRVANAVYSCVRKKRVDVILPTHMRFFIALGNAFPKLGDWFLMHFTSKKKSD